MPATNETCTSMYCSHEHRLTDGLPVDHACYIIPVTILELERQGEFTKAFNRIEIWRSLSCRKPHVGIVSKL